MPPSMTAPYIPGATLDAYTSFANYMQNKGVADLTRNARVTNRRTSDTAPQAISDFNTEYGLGSAKQIGNMSLSGAGQAENEVMKFGGVSPFSGSTLIGQSGEDAITREFNKSMQEEEWANQQQMADKQASAALWGSVFGTAGSIFAGGLSKGGFSNK